MTKVFYRTAPATPGLLNVHKRSVKHSVHLDLFEYVYLQSEGDCIILQRLLKDLKLIFLEKVYIPKLHLQLNHVALNYKGKEKQFKTVNIFLS